MRKAPALLAAAPAGRSHSLACPFTWRGRAATRRGPGKGSSRPRAPNATHHRSKRGDSAGDSTRAPRARSRSHSERAGSAWAHRCARTGPRRARACTVAGRLDPLQSYGVGGTAGRRRSRRPRKHLDPPGKRLLSRKSRTASRLRKRPRDAPRRSATSPQLTDAPTPVCLPPHPKSPHAQGLNPDALPAAFRGTQAPSGLPPARATGGSSGLRGRRALGTGRRGARSSVQSAPHTYVSGIAPPGPGLAGDGAANGEESCRVAPRSLRAHGEVGARAGTCRSPGAPGPLCSARPPARAAGIRPRRAAPRPPPRRRGEPAGPPGSVCPSGPAGARRCGAGGTGRGWPPRSRPLGPRSACHLAPALGQHSPGGGRGAAPRAAVGSRGLAAR